MAKVKRLSRVARDCNVGINTIVEFLSKKGFDIDSSPNSKIPEEALALVMSEFQQDQSAKREAEKFTEEHRHESRLSVSLENTETKEEPQAEEEIEQEDVLLITDKGAESKISSTKDKTDLEPEKTIEPEPVKQPEPKIEKEPETKVEPKPEPEEKIESKPKPDPVKEVSPKQL